MHDQYMSSPRVYEGFEGWANLVGNRDSSKVEISGVLCGAVEEVWIESSRRMMTPFFFGLSSRVGNKDS